MLSITVLGEEYYSKEEGLVYPNATTIHLEHSLVSLSKWEQIFEKPFLSKEEKSADEILTYINLMILDDKIPEGIIYKLSKENFESINAYINSKQSATWFNDRQSSGGTGEQITSELIYYWMAALQLPVEHETWHLNRLFSLIRIANVKNSKPKPMSAAERNAQQRAENERRKAAMKTRG